MASIPLARSWENVWKDEMIWSVKKLSKGLVIETKMVCVVNAPKTNIKIALKTYLLYLRSAFLMLPSTKGSPLMPVRGGGKNGNEKGVFMWVPDVFGPKNDWRKTAKSNNQMHLWTSEQVRNSWRMNQNALLMDRKAYTQSKREKNNLKVSCWG